MSSSGAAIFSAVDGRGDDAPAHEIQDRCSGHPELSGQYHYHGPSDCMTEVSPGTDGHSGLVGYAVDGFGIFGSRGSLASSSTATARQNRNDQPAPTGGPGDILTLAAKELGVDIEALRQAVGPPPPNFRHAAKVLGISESRIKAAMRRARQQTGN